MNKFYRFLKKILLFLSIAIILWFCVYFLYGDRISLTFTDRTFASYFPQILVFLTAASIYGLFILSIKSRRKKWGNLLLFFCGLILALLPFIAYHGYFQYQCGFWNEDLKKGKILFTSELNSSEKIQIIETKCKIQSDVKTDTVHIQKFTPYFELINDVKLYPTEKSNWVKVK
jgi:hypothetical protein